MASPAKDGGPPHGAVIDALIREYRPGTELLNALNERRAMFGVRVRAVRAVEADRTRPKHERLGMKRIAWLLYVDEQTLRDWWAAYEKGGVGALRSRAGSRWLAAESGSGAPAEAMDTSPARSAGGAPRRSLSVEEFGREIKKRTGVEYSKSHLYALLAKLDK